MNQTEFCCGCDGVDDCSSCVFVEKMVILMGGREGGGW